MANRILGLIRSYQYHDRGSMKMLFIAPVRPYLEFGNGVWRHFQDDGLLVS